MSQYQPYYSSMPPSPQRFGAPSRPGAVTALAILGIIFGSIGVLCSGPGAAMIIAMPLKHPLFDAMRSNPDYVRFLWASAIGATTLGLVLLIGSIGSLGLRRWAWALMIGYAGVGLVWRIIEMAWQFSVLPAVLDQAGQRTSGPQAPIGSMLPSLLVGAVTSLAFPTIVLIFYLRANVKAAFGRPA